MAESSRQYNLSDTRKKPQGALLKRWEVEYSKLISNENKRIPMETVKSVICSAFEDGMFEQWRIVLKCPLSGQRIKVPARYADCTHIECFDLEAFLRMKTQKNFLVCPICQKEVEKPLANLQIDNYIETVLSTMPSAMQVELLPDGSFTEVHEEFVVVPNVINDEEPYVQDNNILSFNVKQPQGALLKRWEVEYSKLISNENKRIPMETVKSVICSAFEDGMFEQWRIVLKCPLSGQRIKVPARYADCTHIECFDLEAFLRMKTQKNFLVCPICQKEVEKPLANLQIDNYIETVLSTMPSAMQVELLPDGSFTEVHEEFVVVPNVINDEEPYVQDNNILSFNVKQGHSLYLRRRSPVYSRSRHSRSPERDISTLGRRRSR